MRDWTSKASHLATVVAVGFVLLSTYVGAVAYMTTESSLKDERVEVTVNTIAIAVLQRDYADIKDHLTIIGKKIDRIGPRLPPPGFWCRGQEDC